MKKNSLDITIWRTAQENSQDDSTRRDFEFYFQNKKVGLCSIRLCHNAYGICGEKQFFPENWFCEEKQPFDFFGQSNRLKPFLEIANFDFSNFQGQGFGRMGLQKMYQLSKILGAEGRISLDAQKKATSKKDPTFFYEHCGFKGNEGESGRKYFDPSPENVGLLFSKLSPSDFLIKEIPVQDDGILLINQRTGQFRITQKLKKILEQQKN